MVRNFVRMLAGIPFMSEGRIREGEAIKILEDFQFNPYSQYYEQNLRFQGKVLIYYPATWIQ